MISTATVLVFGAGVSHNYGFPLGSQLVRIIVEGLSDQNTHFFELVRGATSADHDHIRAFARDLRQSRRSSVDRFLESRPDYLKVGKAAIATALIPKELEHALYQQNAEDPYHTCSITSLSGLIPKCLERIGSL